MHNLYVCGMAFEWDENKNATNLKKHGIDFVRAKEIWQGPVLEMLSPQTQHGEQRLIAIGKVDGLCLAVIYTWRGENRRLISARRARRNEQARYEAQIR